MKKRTKSAISLWCAALALGLSAIGPSAAQDSLEVGKFRTRVSPHVAGVFIEGKYYGTAAMFGNAGGAIELAPGVYNVELIDPRAAIAIGMLPDLPLDSYKSLGNSSLGGAARALTSVDFLEEIDVIRNRITYLELNVNQEFMNRFSAAKFLPHTDASLFPSVKKGV